MKLNITTHDIRIEFETNNATIYNDDVERIIKIVNAIKDTK